MEDSKRKLNLEEATMKALYDGLDSDIDDIEGLVDDILVVTDPTITEEEYEEVIDRAQEIVEDTPEGEIPFDEEYLDQYLLTCPICGATFVSQEILEPGSTCPICLDIPEAFVVKGVLQEEGTVAEEYGLTDGEDEEEEQPVIEEPLEDEDKEEETEEPLVASEEVKESDKKLTENKLEEDVLEEATLNFKGAGIVRAPELDFSDDGNRFRGYKVGEMPITYLKDRGQVYLNIRPDYLTGLNYGEYSKLPSYPDANKYNGVDENKVDLKDVVEIATKLYNEYQEAINNLQDVSDDDFKAVTDTYYEKAKNEFEEAKNKIESLGVEKLLNLSEYEIKNLKRYLGGLRDSIKDWSWERQQNTDQSTRRQRMTDEDKAYRQKTSWYLGQINEIVDKAQKVQEEYTGLREDKESDVKEIMKIVKEPIFENKETKLTESNNNDVELPSTSDGTAEKEIQDMLDRTYNKETKVGIEEAKSKVTHEDDKTTMTEFTFDEEDVKFVQELLGPSFDVTLTDEQGVMDIKLTHNEYVDGGIVNLTDDFVRKVIAHVKESQPNVRFNSINRNTTIILTPDIQNKQTESKELDEKRLGNNTFTDRDEAEYYKNKELYANSGLERHREAMEKAKRACEQKGIEVDETQGVYEGKKLTEGECLTIDGPITDYIDILENREQWDYPLEDEDEATNNNDYCVKSKADKRIYEVTPDEWNLIASKLNIKDKEVKTESVEDEDIDFTKMNAKEIAQYIFDNFEKITGKEKDYVFNESDESGDTPLFNNEKIDETFGSISELLDGQDVSSRIVDDTMEELDGLLTTYYNKK